ncbi:MAG: alpha/beta hydrolase [Pigmentiphaga sp.]|uniref:alpha/beta fold hydrolase n=1 Tax=Pigmentiphaga sp. TaxID=1977564 RepID=UPI0029A61CBB|nr:alpha/beta hydrolase [Pigmentiphaga sp.]MDX3906841.1 alpha/beta hydrolase [Pigmentiphaga sp.]
MTTALPPSFTDVRVRYPVQTFCFDGEDWTVRDTGGAQDGAPPLVLLPGALGTGDVFYRLMAELGHRRRLISITYPAIGEARMLARGVVHVMEALGLSTVHLLGTSLGGYVAQIVAMESSARLRKLILANTFYDPALQQARWPAVEIYAQSSPEDILAAARTQLEQAPEPTSRHAELKAVMLHLVGAEQDARAVKAMRLAVLTAMPLPAVPLPAQAIALIDDDEDPVIASPTREQMRQRYASSPLFRIPGGGHYPANLQPERYRAAIEDFLAS